MIIDEKLKQQKQMSESTILQTDIDNLVKEANADLKSSSCHYTRPYMEWLEKKLIELRKKTNGVKQNI